tara:strand:+ start:68 stop:1318 length:1251 start_codon:yes stop_codon:yes gene_type:complete
MENLPKGVESMIGKDGKTRYYYQGQEYENLEDIRGFLGFPLRSSGVPKQVGETLQKVSEVPGVSHLFKIASTVGELTELPGEEQFANLAGQGAQNWGLPYWTGQMLGYLAYPGFGETKALTKTMEAAQVARKGLQLQPVGLLAESAQIAQKTDGPLVSNVFAAITKETKQTQRFKDWYSGGVKHGTESIAKGNTKTPMKGYKPFIDTTDGKTYFLGTERSTKTGKLKYVIRNKEGRQIREITRRNARKLDEQTLLKQFGGDTDLVKSYQKTNKTVYKNLELELQKINKAGQNKYGKDWIDYQVEHIVDVQNFGKLGKEVPTFSGKGADELWNLTALKQNINAAEGAKAMKLEGTTALTKAVQNDNFIPYDLVTREFFDFDMAKTVSNMKSQDWKRLTQLVLENPDMNVHQILINNF